MLIRLEPQHVHVLIKATNILTMKIIKSKQANLENKRIVYFEVGLMLALALVLLAFEWRSTDTGDIGIRFDRAVLVEEDMAEITVQKKKQPEMPKPQLVQKIEVVLDDVEIDDDDLVINAENDENTVNDLDRMIEDEPERETEEETPFRIVQEMPSFPGGDQAYFKYMNSNLKYPAWAREANIKGTVYVQFIIGTDGAVRDASVQRGIGGGCDEEALRVVSNMPRWNPGRQLNKAVPVIMILPVKFELLN